MIAPNTFYINQSINQQQQHSNLIGICKTQSLFDALGDRITISHLDQMDT
jgi:hypothetical protein